jgi:hypothetical protein
MYSFLQGKEKKDENEEKGCYPLPTQPNLNSITLFIPLNQFWGY